MPSSKHRWLRMAAAVFASLLTSACSAADKQPGNVLVAGASGQTGQLIVRELQRAGYRVHALVRDKAKAAASLGPDVNYVQGDVTDPASLAGVMSGIDAVISAIGARGKEGPNRPEMVDYQGVRHLVDAAKQAGVQHFVLVSSRGVTQEDHMLNRVFGNVLQCEVAGRGLPARERHPLHHRASRRITQ